MAVAIRAAANGTGQGSAVIALGGAFSDVHLHWSFGHSMEMEATSLEMEIGGRHDRGWSVYRA